LGGGNLHLTAPTPAGSLSGGATGLQDPLFFPMAVNYRSGALTVSGIDPSPKLSYPLVA
jgi:hypothetical protein